MRWIQQSWLPEAQSLGFVSEAEMLKHFYVECNMGISAIATILGYSKWSVRQRLSALGVPMRSRGGAQNRLGRRYLKMLSHEELFGSSVARLMERHAVSAATVYFERRFRLREQERKKDGVRLHTTDTGLPALREDE